MGDAVRAVALAMTPADTRRWAAAHFAGVDSYIGKPFSRDALVAAIRRARAARDAEAEKAAQMRA